VSERPWLIRMISGSRSWRERRGGVLRETTRDPARAIVLLEEVQALASRWNDIPDYTATQYDRGRVDQRHDMTMELLVALTSPAPSESPRESETA
jgi:hypothetical protein